MKNWHFGHEGLPSKAHKNFQSHRLVAVVIGLLCRHFGRHVVLAWSLHYTYSGALLKMSLMSCNMYVMSWLARKLRHGDLQKEIHPRKKIIIGIRQSVAVSLRKKKRRNERLFEIFNAWNRFSLLYICLVQFFSKIGRRPSKEKKKSVQFYRSHYLASTYSMCIDFTKRQGGGSQVTRKSLYFQ